MIKMADISGLNGETLALDGNKIVGGANGKTYRITGTDIDSFATRDYVDAQIGSVSPEDIAYDGGESGLMAENVKDAIDEIATFLPYTEVKNWQQVQDIVRRGLASKYFNIGDQFEVDRFISVTASVGSSTGVSAATVDADDFIEGCKETKGGQYPFVYDGHFWRDGSGDSVDLDDYGISVTGTPDIGDIVTVTLSTDKLKFDVIGIDHDTPVNTSYTHSMTLQLHDVWGTAMVFDASEAAFYIDEDTYPTGLAADTYNFTWNYASGSIVSGTYQFTLTEAVPAGGQIVIGTNSNSSAINSCKISTYAAPGDTTAIESNVAISEGSDGTSLGIIASTGITNGNINCAQCVLWGSSSWKASSLRQWLNTDGAANTWWEAKTVFDRPANANRDGFLKGMDPDFLSVIGEVNKTTKTYNSVLETNAEKFFLLSKAEAYGYDELRPEGAVYAYYGEGYSDLSSPGSGEDANRIKYRSAVAANWYLRSSYFKPYVVRYILNTGTMREYTANTASGVAPACVIV